MKIAVPIAKPNGWESKIIGHFGRAPFYAIVNTENEKVEFIEIGFSEILKTDCSRQKTR